MLPGAGIGAITGVFAGLATLVVGLSPGLAAVNGLALGIPMALFGGAYTILCARGFMVVGVFAPCALYWVVGYPVSRIVQEGSAGLYLGAGPGLSTDLLAFYLYNALLAPGLAFGFIWMHERLLPPWLLRIRDHNRLAAVLAEAYLTYASRVYEQKQRWDAMRRARKKERPAGA